MYQFARWKYVLVILVMVAGTIFAMPNAWDAVAPALQLSRNDRKPMDAPSKQRIEDLLKAQKIAIDNDYLEADRLVMRFDTTPEQPAARQAILKGAPGEF